MKIDKEQLLCARLKNQFLLERTPCAAVVSALCGLQAQFANNPKYALRIRGSDFNESGWSDGLVKTWSFRHTLHTVRLDELGLFLSARGVPERWEDAWDLKGDRLEYAADFLLERIRSGMGEREALRKACREAGFCREELDKIFYGWGGVFYELNRRGLIVYHPGTAKKFLPCSGVVLTEPNAARDVVLRRYFQAFGPATIEDCAAFTGYRKREVLGLIEKRGIALRSALVGGAEYFYLGDLPGADTIPSCLFLAGFDQMIMGYKDRACILDEKLKREVITASGIVHPAVLLKGQISARWKKDGSKLIIVPFVKMSKKHRSAIAAFGERLFRDDASGVTQIIFE
jgi:hypothetical protein